jgi:hypothetical protein
MARLKSMQVCERVLIESGSNLMSLIALIDEIKVGSEPPDPPPGKKRFLVPHKFSVVITWSRSKPEVPEFLVSRSRLLSPAGKIFAVSEHLLDLTSAPNARAVIQTQGFPWHGEGVYRVAVDLQRGKGWKKIAEEPIRVFVERKEQGTTLALETVTLEKR